MKSLSGLLLLVCAPVIFAAGAGYPKERIAEFVVEKLDVNSLPDALQPKHEKGKKTFGDYGFVSSHSQDNEFFLQGANGNANYDVKVLDRSDSGIYVCVSQESNTGDVSFQRALLLKHRNPSGLLKGREAFREFAGCSAIGAGPEDFYGG